MSSLVVLIHLLGLVVAEDGSLDWLGYCSCGLLSLDLVGELLSCVGHLQLALLIDEVETVLNCLCSECVSSGELRVLLGQKSLIGIELLSLLSVLRVDFLLEFLGFLGVLDLLLASASVGAELEHICASTLSLCQKWKRIRNQDQNKYGYCRHT